jgi:hypothetical protein
VGEGKSVRVLVDEVHKREGERAALDREIAQIEERTQCGNLDVATALRELRPVVVSWRDTMHRDSVRAREVLRKLIVAPIAMEPLPALHGYRWRGQLNGGAILEGSQKYLGCRGRESNPHGASPAGF